MFTIGVISDTHINDDNYSDLGIGLIEQLKKSFKNIDEIVHAGDICSKKFLNDLNEIAPVSSVLGHEDSLDLKPYITFKRGNYIIGVIHERPNNLEEFVKENNLHILIYGHTHQPLIKGTNYNTLLLNPGSPTYPKAPLPKPGFDIPIPRPSVIILNIDEEDILSTYLINLKQ